MNHSAEKSFENRADFVLVNHEKDANCHARAIALAEQNGPPFAHVIRIGDPSPEWLATNHLGPLSVEQRAAFDRDGIVLLLQHPTDPLYMVPIADIAAKAVAFGSERLESESGIPVQVAKQDDPASQESHAASLAARTAYVVERLDGMTDAERASFFRQAYREMADHDAGRALIERFTMGDLTIALNQAWATRRHGFRHGRSITRPQGE